MQAYDALLDAAATAFLLACRAPETSTCESIELLTAALVARTGRRDGFPAADVAATMADFGARLQVRLTEAYDDVIPDMVEKDASEIERLMMTALCAAARTN